ncbi:PQQ-dependent sugar dehydrogenase [Flagellatimonas centrodinii]|uniref:PQQ-dependent sugar dehydrogenase n=1 Tax=Flagellatimonas centrodinii TaxID=2806210 RepID=UPI001FEFD1A3|nr:PQQ-dependent sugar dehydrogenase [Flagellatimonas centrodinii]ULQ47755.1 PQQ-dependent sugar dehydrogenase [Flagellatimonas centrodinii]
MVRPRSFALYCALIVSACGGDETAAPHGLDAREAPVSVAFTANTGADADVAVVNAYPQLQFDRPVDFAEVPGSNHAVVVEHPGRIRVFARDSTTIHTDLFADLSDRVRFDNNEQGLVRIAFDPDYANTGRLYLAYAGRQADDPARCAPLCSVLSRFTHVPGNPLLLDPASETRLIVLPQPGEGHNIGNLLFGADGYLYVGVGDGGFSFTPYVNAQDRTTLYGSVLRLDVAGDGAYAVPPDNPFVGVGNEVAGVVGAGQPVREEIWAFGLRNPHRFSIDPVTGTMWLADVGQSAREEVNRITPGGNYGWPAYEGEISQGRSDIGRDDSAYRAPVLTYPRSDGSSITGGLVYRGNQLPQLRGRYLFTDYVSGTLWSLDPATGSTP